MWRKETWVGHLPLPRSGAAGVAIGPNKLVFFGGNACSSGENFLSDTYVYDTETGVCVEIDPENQPPLTASEAALLMLSPPSSPIPPTAAVSQTIASSSSSSVTSSASSSSADGNQQPTPSVMMEVASSSATTTTFSAAEDVVTSTVPQPLADDDDDGQLDGQEGDAMMMNADDAEGDEQQPQQEEEEDVATDANGGDGDGAGIPCAMDRHTAIAHRGAMYVFGGDRGWTLTNKLWCFNPRQLRWREVQTESPPCPRRGHTAVKSCARSSMLVFGGMVMSHVPYYLFGRLVTSNVSVNDIWECFLDASPMPRWRRVGNGLNGGPSPSPRRGHTCVLFDPDEQDHHNNCHNDNGNNNNASTYAGCTRFYVFGGYCELDNSPGVWYNDLWRFTVEREEWHKVVCWGSVPEPRVGHCAAKLTSHSFLVFGGGTLDNNTNTLYECQENGMWRIIEPGIGSVPPSPRSYVACVLSQDGKTLYLYGGCDNDQELSCMYSLDMDIYHLRPRTLLNYVAECILANGVEYNPLLPLRQTAHDMDEDKELNADVDGNALQEGGRI